MVSLSYSAPAPSSHDPIFLRTHFLGRVASDGQGLEYRHELLKHRSSRHSDLHRCDSHWLASVTHSMSYDSDDSTDTDQHVLHPRPAQNKSNSPQHPRSRSSSTIPLSITTIAPVGIARPRSMTAPLTSSFTPSVETRTLQKNRSVIGDQSKLMPARPLTIDTAQPLRLSSQNLSALSAQNSLTVNMSWPMEAVPSSKTSSPPVVRIQCSQSDGSCHGDAGDQDPEAQLATGIIRLREQRKASPSKSHRRTGPNRGPSPAYKQQQQQLNVSQDIDSDDAQSIVIRNHGSNFVLRLAGMLLNFGSSALEKLLVSDNDDSFQKPISQAPQSPLQPRNRSSTTPQQLSAEAGELLRRRRERIGSVLPSDFVSESDSSTKATLTRSWSVPKLLSPPLFNPCASLRALSSSTASWPTTPISAPPHFHPTLGFTSIAEAPSKYREIRSFDDIGASFSRQSACLYTHSCSVDEVVPESGHVSPRWRQ
ncbi:uncharacterized protein UDID_07585 [Ustilago sp. UG-2017a]|nr:uncharacterized protein UDID_07585 [Ustilago sp. UG-2017a]